MDFDFGGNGPWAAVALLMVLGFVAAVLGEATGNPAIGILAAFIVGLGTMLAILIILLGHES